MSDRIKVMVLTDAALDMLDVAQMHGYKALDSLETIHLTEEFGRVGGRRRFVSKWETMDRKPTTDVNTSSSRVPTPVGGQKDPISSTTGVGPTVGQVLSQDPPIYTKFPQPADASPPVASSPAPGGLPSRGRAAETTIRCHVCRGRGETLWVEQTWSMMDVPETELEECENCQGSGFELVEVDRVAP